MQKIAQCVAIIIAALCTSLASAQQPFPSRPVRIVVPASVGGTTDLLARAIAQQLSARWKQPVIVDNRPGANQIIGAEWVAKAAPDGHTLLLSDSSTFVINPHLYRNLPYDASRDFTPIAPIGSASPVIALSASVPAKSLDELLALARAKPGMLSYGSMGTGSYSHIAIENFKRVSGVDILHVPYKGAAPAITELLGGNISMMLVNIAGLLPHQEAGKVRIVATTAAKRLERFPKIPSVSESAIPGFEANTWFGIVGPAGMDPEVVRTIHAEVERAVQSPAFTDQVLPANSIEPMRGTPEQFNELLRTDLSRWKALVAASGATLE